MNKRPDALIYAIALGALIVVGIITTSIINVVKNNEGAADIRAKAGTLNTLKFTGAVADINSDTRVLTVSDVQFDEESRSGKAVNYGTWIVTAPNTFDLFSAGIGSKVSFTISSATFNVANKEVAAVEMKLVK